MSHWQKQNLLICIMPCKASSPQCLHHALVFQQNLTEEIFLSTAEEKDKKFELNTNILTGSEINLTDSTRLHRVEEIFFLLWGQGKLEIVHYKQVKIEHTATLITLLADREVQLRPWEGNYSHNVWRVDKREKKSGGWGKGGELKKRKERFTSDTTQRRGNKTKTEWYWQ